MFVLNLYYTVLYKELNLYPRMLVDNVFSQIYHIIFPESHNFLKLY